MGWNREQQYRLALEKKLLDRYMPGFALRNTENGAQVTGWAHTNSGHRYGTHIDVSFSYPYDCPDLFIVSPCTLIMHDGIHAINDLGTSHAFHVHDNRPGCVEICHTQTWDSSHTLLQVLLKCHCWCEAYVAHLKTGRDIASFLC